MEYAEAIRVFTRSVCGGLLNSHRKIGLMWKGQEMLLKAIVDQTQSISAIQGGVYCVVYSSSSIRAQSLDTTGAAGMVDFLQNGKSWFIKKTVLSCGVRTNPLRSSPTGCVPESYNVIAAVFLHVHDDRHDIQGRFIHADRG